MRLSTQRLRELPLSPLAGTTKTSHIGLVFKASPIYRDLWLISRCARVPAVLLSSKSALNCARGMLKRATLKQFWLHTVLFRRFPLSVHRTRTIHPAPNQALPSRRAHDTGHRHKPGKGMSRRRFRTAPRNIPAHGTGLDLGSQNPKSFRNGSHNKVEDLFQDKITRTLKQ